MTFMASFSFFESSVGSYLFAVVCRDKLNKFQFLPKLIALYGFKMMWSRFELFLVLPSRNTVQDCVLVRGKFKPHIKIFTYKSTCASLTRYSSLNAGLYYVIIPKTNRSYEIPHSNIFGWHKAYEPRTQKWNQFDFEQRWFLLQRAPLSTLFIEEANGIAVNPKYDLSSYKRQL